MLIFLFAFIAGLAASEWFSHVILYAVFVCDALVLLGVFCRARPFFPRFLVLSLILFFGFLYGALNQAWIHHRELAPSLIKKNVLIEGHIDSIPKASSRWTQFDFLSDTFNGKPQTLKLKLSWYNNTKKLLAGEKCVFTVRLKPVHGLKNPGSFDFEKYLKSNGIWASGYVVNRENPHCENKSPWNYYVLTSRQKIQDRITKAITFDHMAGLIAALTVGSRNEMSSSQWKVLQNTGTSHLMAISGLHVAFIAGLVYGFFNILWRLFPILLRKWPAQKAASLMAMLGAIIYGLLAGFSLPTQRAVIMILVLIGFEFFNKTMKVMDRLLWAAVIILLFQPLAISQASFWLSFAAVAWICFGVLGYQKTAKYYLWLRVQWVCFLGLLPLSLFYFQQISLVSFLANTLAIPWVGFVIVPLCFMSSLLMLFHSGLAQGLFWLAGYLFWPLWKILLYLGELHFAVWHKSLQSTPIFLSSLIAVILCLAPRAWPGRWLAFIFALPLFFYTPEKPGPGDVWLTVLDVGQGLASVIETEHHVLVYDAGPKTYGGFDAGESVVLPFLRSRGITSLDMMIISHGDQDHLGGAPAILSVLPTAILLSSEPQKLSSFSAKNCLEGQKWAWDGVEFSILNPPKNEAYLRNNSSCVLQVRAHHQVILLPGDIEKEGEAFLLRRYPHQLQASLMVAPHHGSKTSSTADFLAAVKPHYVIAATGFYNAFHFPSREVLTRYAAFHVTLLDTATEGAIQARVGASGQLKLRAMTK